MRSPAQAVVIGSGAAGMTAAILLARAGVGVTVLERHAVPGGLSQTYYRHGRRLPTGVHCLGALDPGQALWRYFNYLGVLDHLRLRRLADDCTAQYHQPGGHFRWPAGHDRLHAALLDRFPHERPAIDRFVTDLRRCVTHFPLYHGSIGEHDVPADLTISLGAYVAGLTHDRHLRFVLTANAPLTGVEPSACPLFLHLIQTDSFVQSTYRLDPHGPSLGEALATTLRRHGGALRLRCPVQRIIVDDAGVRGVETPEGLKPCDTVIFTGHPAALPDLCLEALRPSYVERLRGLPSTHGAFGLAAAWRGSPCPGLDHDHFMYSEVDPETAFFQQLGPPGAHPRMVYCSAHAHRPGDATLCALTIMPYADVADFDQPGARSAAYHDLKDRVAERLLQLLDRFHPRQGAAVEVLDTYTPLTFAHYTATPQGSAYGVRRAMGALLTSRVHPVTRVPGLLLAGQSIVAAGVLGAVVSGVLAAGMATDLHGLLHRIRRECG